MKPTDIWKYIGEYLAGKGGILGVALLLGACSEGELLPSDGGGKNTGSTSTTTPAAHKYTSTRDTTEYAYKDGQYILPVICHVFYTSKGDSTYIPPERIAHIFDQVNAYYKKNHINVTFRLTTLPPVGKDGIDYAGVEYIPWKEKSIKMSEVMGDEKVNAPYKKYLWDPNRYINVMFYNFKPETEDGEYITLGVSHLPLTFEGKNRLKGLQDVDSLKYGSYFTLNDINWAPCSSINSTYAYEESDGNSYNTADVTVTVAHELGHYLGLLHAFTENEAGEMADSCGNSDYCDDTPSYNRVAYTQWLNNFFEEHRNDKQFYMEDVVGRHGCEVDSFPSHNIMDYYMSFTDEFTADQKARMNNVLTYSPLVPRNARTTRSLLEYTGRKLDVKVPVSVEPALPRRRVTLVK